MKNILIGSGLVMSLSIMAVKAQDVVVAAQDPKALFTSPDAGLHKNKQVVYHIVKDLLESNHWELADKYISERYIQHNPNAGNGRQAVVKFFTEILKVKPTPIPEKMKSKVVSVVAEGDLVTVAFVRNYKHPKDSARTYTTTWFDQWRIVNGKADEHWDGALLMP
ncbi:Predicted SnoaL-like aldol condensation-catalyzing enzyme [Dyadobacter koreensis]|uniref:Predicted SnoaL-like aldol condensation-catalyzing enzyme n=1 Tax=Dyadobacter koreensis TaxID=408657 RepID=A0A1H6SPR9_9BACT|nr:nuclear transport factor 2 family protein [Dyadobacter koreensis]SEI69821.1 Predicted SnoaL-like aldol condensation-catalyzing enzyme [Dyadobacter koreensis]